MDLRIRKGFSEVNFLHQSAKNAYDEPGAWEYNQDVQRLSNNKQK